MTILAARQPGDQQAPKLKLKKLHDGTLEVSLRDSEAAEAAVAAAAAAAQPGGVVPGALAPQVWAWPLPLVGLQDWVPYETLLRSILAAQPLQQLQRELQKGVALRLTKSSVTGVSLVHFDMELAGPVGQEPAVLPADMLLDMDSKLRAAGPLLGRVPCGLGLTATIDCGSWQCLPVLSISCVQGVVAANKGGVVVFMAVSDAMAADICVCACLYAMCRSRGWRRGAGVVGGRGGDPGKARRQRRR